MAIKVIMKSKLHSDEELRRARLELEVHADMNHAHVLPFLAAEETSDSLILVTPLATGDLNSMTVNRVLSEGNCRNLCRQLLLGLNYLHNERGLLHGDIKPANILLFRNPVSGKYIAKICDFGFADFVKPGESLPFSGLRGSLGYFAPEQLNRQDYGSGVDMFVLGVISYTLLCGYEPFYPSNLVGKLGGSADEEILKFDSPYWDSISAEAKNFVKSLLCGNPDERMSAKAGLASAWLMERGVEPHPTSEDMDVQFE